MAEKVVIGNAELWHGISADLMGHPDGAEADFVMRASDWRKVSVVFWAQIMKGENFNE